MEQRPASVLFDVGHEPPSHIDSVDYRLKDKAELLGIVLLFCGVYLASGCIATGGDPSR
jgi:hypothetical protein